LLPQIKRDSLVNTESVVHVSAAKNVGLDTLLQRIDELIEDDPLRRVHVRIPQSEGKTLAMLDAKARIYLREYREGYVDLDVEAPESVLRQMKEFVMG
jgi:50S ribosomal subunit-associated GTPase HflX